MFTKGSRPMYPFWAGTFHVQKLFGSQFFVSMVEGPPHSTLEMFGHLWAPPNYNLTFQTVLVQWHLSGQHLTRHHLTQFCEKLDINCAKWAFINIHLSWMCDQEIFKCFWKHNVFGMEFHCTGFIIHKLLNYFPPKILYFITKDINLCPADGVWCLMWL